MKHLLTSIEISQEISSLFVVGQGYFSLGHIYSIEKNLNEAKKCIDEAKKCIDEAAKAFDKCELEALSNQAKDALSTEKIT